MNFDNEIFFRWGSIDYSEAHLNEVKLGDVVAHLIYKQHGNSGNIALSTVIINGEIEQARTSNTLHWQSPSNTWIETGTIAVQSDCFIDAIHWNASGLLDYEYDNYVFKVDDYSSNGEQLFLAMGYGRYDVNCVESW